jgi:Spy/CpxP family protein refolding chaperone
VMRTVMLSVALALVLPLTAQAQGQQAQGQQAQGQRRGPPPSVEQRAEMEARVIRRFAQQASRQMGLSEEMTGRLEQILTDGARRRFELFRETVELRQRLARAVQSPATTDAQFNELMREMSILRGREQALWRRDQEALAQVLTPRQRAQFMMHWTELQDGVRGIMDRRPGH